jgi:hypothetical protein
MQPTNTFNISRTPKKLLVKIARMTQKAAQIAPKLSLF